MIRTILPLLLLSLLATAAGAADKRPPDTKNPSPAQTAAPHEDPDEGYDVPERPGPDAERPPAPKPAVTELAVKDLNARIRNTKPGETIVIPPGTYNVDSDQALTVHGKHGLTLKGGGKVNLVSRNPESQIVEIKESSDVVLEGFAVYHDVKVSCAATCISIEDSSRVTAKNCDIHGSGAYGVGAWGDNNKDIRIVGNNIHHCSYWGAEIHTKGGEISGNTFFDNGGNDLTGDREGIKEKDNQFPDLKNSAH